MTLDGQLTTLVNFNATNGAFPIAGLTLGNDGNFYGTTESGGDFNRGTLFRITPTGRLTTLVSFDGTNGESPFAAVTLGGNRTLYGTTATGGTSGAGTVFKFPTLNP
jgi:uncharacterized repeat protein (TIGR03803 family)